MIFNPVRLRVLFFLEVCSFGVGLISWSCPLFLIPSEGCVWNAFCYSSVTSPSACWFHPSVLTTAAVLKGFSILPSLGEHAHCTLSHIHWPLTCAELLAQLFLFFGIPFILVQQAFPITCFVTLADCAWSQGIVVGNQHWDYNRACPGVDMNVCRGLSVSLATLRGVQAAVFKLSEFSLLSVCNKMCLAVKEGFMVQRMTRLPFAVILRKSHSAWGKHGGITHFGSTSIKILSKGRASLTNVRRVLFTYCI